MLGSNYLLRDGAAVLADPLPGDGAIDLSETVSS